MSLDTRVSLWKVYIIFITVKDQRPIMIIHFSLFFLFGFYAWYHKHSILYWHFYFRWNWLASSQSKFRFSSSQCFDWTASWMSWQMPRDIFSKPCQQWQRKVTKLPPQYTHLMHVHLLIFNESSNEMTNHVRVVHAHKQFCIDGLVCIPAGKSSSLRFSLTLFLWYLTNKGFKNRTSQISFRYNSLNMNRWLNKCHAQMSISCSYIYCMSRFRDSDSSRPDHHLKFHVGDILWTRSTYSEPYYLLMIFSTDCKANLLTNNCFL